MTLSHPYCGHLASPNGWTLALSIILVLGILVSYLPQHIKIIQNGTSVGLSPWWVMLGAISSMAAIANIISLPTSQHDMACCREISAGACASALLGIVQIGVIWTCFMIILILFLVYFPRQPEGEQEDAGTHEAPLLRRRDAVIVGCTSLAALLFVGIGSLVFIVRYPAKLLGWANFLGLCSSVLSCFQYFPQLWTTYKIKRIASLSITTMVIQVPGAFLFAYSLFLRVGWQGWSSWFVFCITGLFQGCLLGLAISFWLADRGKQVEGGSQEYSEEPAESDPLLPPSGRSTQRAINGSNKRNPLSMLYTATPPDQMSSPSDGGSSPEVRRR